MNQFLVAFEATGFARTKAVVGHELSKQMISEFSKNGKSIVKRHDNFVEVRSGYITDDDGQDDGDVKIFAHIELVMELHRLRDASKIVPDKEFLSEVTKRMIGRCSVDMDESTWEVVDVEEVPCANAHFK